VKQILYRGLPGRLEQGFSRIMSSLNPGADTTGLSRLIHPDLAQLTWPNAPPSPRRYRDDLNERLYRDLTRDNLPMLLQYGDRTSMAFSLEARLPYLDHRLIEYCGTLPYHFKIRGQTTKYLLRRVLQDRLPGKVVNRPDKMGYPTPFALWLKDPLRDYVLDTLQSRSFRQHNVFRPEVAHALYEQHAGGRADHAWLIWRIINIEKWLQVFQDDFPASCDRFTPKTPTISRIRPETLHQDQFISV